MLSFVIIWMDRFHLDLQTMGQFNKIIMIVIGKFNLREM